MRGYFWDPPGKKPGINADIERHRKEEAELDEAIAEAESREPGYFRDHAVRAYRHLRCQLLASKAQVVDKLGRKK